MKDRGAIGGSAWRGEEIRLYGSYQANELERKDGIFKICVLARVRTFLYSTMRIQMAEVPLFSDDFELLSD
jgi:hypothetical protein